ncbi:holin [Pseudoclavibacter sp. CFCC 14310]|uniref:holin n=1 Tax=Pseudoclavibacter sp. CFCC 14310 TaxID=2615180 RepID=UPI00130165FF|nr:holin [Pseudoclavibacter sp. CFCC 14310]KAB1647460.1 holin [Pseudoclavibacter sp. CFCC 14310]
MLTLAFWKGLGERAIKTFAQALVAVIGTGALGILDVDWLSALSVAGLATLVSVLTSVGNADFTAGVVADGKHAAD